MDPHNLPVEDRVRLIAHSLGYPNPALYHPTSGRGRAPVDINKLIWELVEKGYKIDMAFAPDTPFFGDPHPVDKSQLLWGFSDSGIPNYISRTAWVYEAKKRLRQLDRSSDTQKAILAKIERARIQVKHWKDDLEKKEELFVVTLPHLQKAFEAARARWQNAETVHHQQTSRAKERLTRAERDLAFLEDAAKKMNLELP